MDSAINFPTRVGTKYYRVKEDNKVEIIRIIKHKNVNTVSVIDDDLYTGGEAAKHHSISIDQLMRDYKMLLPHGQIAVTNVVTESGAKDVLVIANKINQAADIANEFTFSDIQVVCRQLLLDFFAQMTEKSGDKVLGLSTSRESCPANINFNMLYSDCKPIPGESQFISIYQQDTIEQILGLISTKSANAILSTHFNESLSWPERVIGLTSSLRELLCSNGFIHDIRTMFGITCVNNIDVKIDAVNNKYVLYDTEVYRLEYVFKCRMSEMLVIPYDHFIDESKLPDSYSYAKICDDNNRVWIVQYVPVEGFDPSLYPEEVKDGLIPLLPKYL